MSADSEGQRSKVKGQRSSQKSSLRALSQPQHSCFRRSKVKGQTVSKVKGQRSKLTQPAA
eukprot:283744-Rhodomonas_salina.1